jgi:hypothetical protein
MPATSRAQAHFMQVCLHATKTAKQPCPPKAVAREFAQQVAGSTKGSPAFTPQELQAGYRKL